MKVTTDTHTGKPFRWNSTVLYRLDDGRELFVPARYSSRTATHLHPTRVRAEVLARLNPKDKR